MTLQVVDEKNQGDCIGLRVNALLMAAWIPNGLVQTAQYLFDSSLDVSLTLRLELVDSEFWAITPEGLANQRHTVSFQSRLLANEIAQVVHRV